MKRPILIIAVGFIIGIKWGLIFNRFPFLFAFLLLFFIILKVIRINSNKKIIRIIKIFIKNNIIIIFLLSCFLSSLYIIFLNLKYEKTSKILKKNEWIQATIISNLSDGKYNETFIARLENNKNIKLLVRVSNKSKVDLKYADKININGNYELAETSRNYGGFNYRNYLRSKSIYGIFNANNIEILCGENLNIIEISSNKLQNKIIENINKVLPEKTRELFLGILIGYDDNLQEDIKSTFKDSSLSHLLAVSGTHIVYIINVFTLIFCKFKVPKLLRNIITSLFLIYFLFLTEFSSSVVRAVIMGIIALNATLVYRRLDIINNISLSILIILMINPYKILDIGLILSYFCTLGIIVCSKILPKKEEKNKVCKFIKDSIIITIYANIFIMPIIIYSFNTLSLTFIVSNFLAGLLIGGITILGIGLIIISFINIRAAYILARIYNIQLNLLIFISEKIGNLDISKIIVPTPSIIYIICYYLIICSVIFILYFKKKYGNRYIIKKILFKIKILKKIIKQKYKVCNFIILLVVIFNFFINTLQLSLNIYFIDIGQGDATLIVTPNKKKILIDGGGNENYNVGENTLLPYLLDRKITSLDYIIISHFDSDHCLAAMYVMEKIKVKYVIIGEQFEENSNLNKFIEIVNRNNIRLIKVNKGDKLDIEKDIYINILWPNKEKKVNNNLINNNALVFRFNYNNFSVLFTGDIEEESEAAILKEYSNSNILNSTILKVAHHGSKSSTTQKFLEKVNPQIALIGVGKNNTFGHPNKITIKRLEKITKKIYRTDEHGEIKIKLNKKGYQINTCIP